MNQSKFEGERTQDNISQNPQNKPTILIALSKLKSIEERIESTKKKILVMNTKNQRQVSRSREFQRRSLVRSLVQKDVEEYKKKKKLHEESLESRIHENKRKNNEKNKQLKQKIARAKSTCREKKNYIYGITKKQEVQNEKSIFFNRKKDIYEKKKKHQIVLQNQERGRKQIQRYMESKIKAKKNEKEDETNRILDNIEEKQMILAKLQRYSSGNVDEEDDLGLSKMDTDKSKNFRVKIINKGGTTIITQ